MSVPLLEVQNLKTYFFTRRGVVKAVDDVSFSVQKGEALGLVGESGCGKTITCLSILRLVPEPGGKIVGGRILFEGEDLLPKSKSEMRRYRGKRLSMILQDPMSSLNPAYNIGNQIMEAIKLHNKTRGEMLKEKAIEALRLVKIPAPESRLPDYPHQMSGGMRQRISGAISLSCQPSLLIADEPTTSLDVTTQLQYLILLKELQRQNEVGMIFITHDFGVVARVCDRVAVMYAGKIVESANVRELFNNPLHPYTRALMGSVPKPEEKRARLVEIKGQPPDLINMPPGCNFSPRCPKTKDICQQVLPEIVLDKEHYVRCWNCG